MPYTQEGRLISLTAPSAGVDTLLLAGFSGHEAMSRLFSFHLDLLQEAHDPVSLQPSTPLAFSDIIGESVTIEVLRSAETPRYFNGIVSRFAQSGSDSTFIHYQMEVVPKAWLLTRVSDCRIFQNTKVTEIIQQVIQGQGIDFKTSFNAAYSPLEYCVQYRETDFNFISRLMEKYGIFYFFEHTDSGHTMVIADASSANTPCPGQASAGFLVGEGLDVDDVVTSWSLEQELKSGKYATTDYNYLTPSANMNVNEETVDTIAGNSSFEIFDYPGEFLIRGDGMNIAKTRMEEVEATHLVAHGSSVCRSFASGYTFSFTDHSNSAMNGSYILTEIQHVASVAATYSGDGEVNPENETYSNQFICIPDSVPFRPARLTPKPFVQGPQTAMVVGKSASDTSEIYVDSYGRVKVLFHWDGASGRTQNPEYSCWTRVSQEWAGQGWGAITIPRVGQEVIVSFLEGDPDQPIITGRVYNATQPVPYKLPDYQTRSTFMTRSSTRGSASTYNELRFEDKTGAEQVFIRAQYDFDTQVLHDTREAIGNNRSLTVAKDQLETVGGDLHTQVTGGTYDTVGKDVNTSITGGVIETVGKDVNTKITGNSVESVGKDSNSNVTGNINQKAGQTISINAGMNLVESSGQNFSHNAGMAINLKGGTTVTIEAGVTLNLVAGSNSVVIGPSGVSITGTMVMINSGGAASSANCASPTSPTSPASVVAPKNPDKADDGSTGTKLGSGSSSSPSPASSPGAASPSAASPVGAPAPGSLAPASFASDLGGAAGAASGAVSQAEQTAQQATQAAAQGAQQAATAAQAAATEAQQAAQQAEQQAQQAAQQVEQQAQQAAQQAQQAAQQAQQAANQAVGQAKAAAQQAAAQAEQQAQQAQAAAAQAAQQAQAEAAQVQQQAQATAAQAQQQAQQAEQQAQQAQQAVAQAQQQAQLAAQQGEQAAQQAAQEAKQAAQQAQQQAQQAAQQAQAAAAQAQQQAQQAAQQVQQAASGAQQQAQQAAAGAQQAASQAMNQVPKGL